MVHKKLGSLHYLIKDNDKIVKRHLDQLLKNNIKSSVTEDYDIVNNLPTEEESLKNLLSPPVSKVTASPAPLSKSSTYQKSIPTRVSSRINKGQPPLRYGVDDFYDMNFYDEESD